MQRNKNMNVSIYSFIIIVMVVFTVISSGCSTRDNPVAPNNAEVTQDSTSEAESSQSENEQTSQSDAPTQSVETEINEQSPVVQEAYEMWKSFGGRPNFTSNDAFSASIISDLYANHCEYTNQNMDMLEDEATAQKWISAEPIEKFYVSYFNNNLDFIRDESDYYDSEKGYLYSDIFPARPDESKIVSVSNEGNLATMVIAYKFFLPAELYGEDTEANAVHTVTIEVDGDKFQFISAEIEDERAG